MLSSPASACNATGNTAGSIGSKVVASKTSGKAPMSALPLKPAVPLTLQPPATTKVSGGKGTGKGEQNQKPAGKGKKRNAPAAEGDKASPVKTGKSAKSSKQSAKGDKAQYALQMIEKGFTPEQITAMLGN
jgi:hypothetical protein